MWENCIELRSVRIHNESYRRSKIASERTKNAFSDRRLDFQYLTSLQWPFDRTSKNSKFECSPWRRNIGEQLFLALRRCNVARVQKGNMGLRRSRALNCAKSWFVYFCTGQWFCIWVHKNCLWVFHSGCHHMAIRRRSVAFASDGQKFFAQ